MSEYIITIEDWFFKHVHERYTHFFGCPIEEIVRRRDCKYGIDGGEYCAEDCADSWDWRNVEPDGFCAWGERMES